MFIDQGSVAQAYVATLTALSFCIIQTKFMPYESQHDNLLKQICEVQLLMTLLISIVLRTDLVDDLLGEPGYDIILVFVNVFFVPGFMTVVSTIALYSVCWLVYDLLKKKKLIKAKTAAVHEIVYGQTRSVMAEQLEVEVLRQKKAEEERNEKTRLQAAERQEREKRDKEDVVNKFDIQLRPYVTELHRGALSVCIHARDVAASSRD